MTDCKLFNLLLLTTCDGRPWKVLENVNVVILMKIFIFGLGQSPKDNNKKRNLIFGLTKQGIIKK